MNNWGRTPNVSQSNTYNLQIVFNGKGRKKERVRKLFYIFTDFFLNTQLSLFKSDQVWLNRC